MFADESRKETADYKFFYEDGILKKYGKELEGSDIQVNISESAGLPERSFPNFAAGWKR